MYNMQGDIVTIARTGSMVSNLPNKTFLVCFDPNSGFFLKRTEDMKLPEKIYGHNTSNSEKIIKMFVEEAGRTSGALMSGVKGTGKTLTAVETCLMAQELGMPVLLLQDPHCGTAFNDFMAEIKDSCVVFVDEFEKVYSDIDDVHRLLPLLDGAVKTHKLFLLTSNKSLKEVGESMEYLSNRPSRVFYTFEYGTMEDEVIKEYLTDNLSHQGYFEDIFSLKRAFKCFTIDLLKAVTTEVNRYGHTGKSLPEILQDLNVQTDRGLDNYTYTLSLELNGSMFDNRNLAPESMYNVTGNNLGTILGQCEEYYRGDRVYLTFHVPYLSISVDDMYGRFHGLVEDNGYISAINGGRVAYACRNGVEGLYLIDEVDRSYTLQKPEDVLIKMRFNLSEGAIKNGELLVSQDKVTRAISLAHRSGEFTMTFKPLLDFAKPKVVYTI
jgi:hypothetical protein